MIGAIEDTLVNQVKTLFGTRLRKVDSLPGQVSEDVLKRMIADAPAVYVLFAGGAAAPVGDTLPRLDSRWILYVVTAHANGHRARRHGDTRQMGAYEAVSVLAGQLHGWTVPDVGSLSLLRVDLLYQDAFEDKGVTLYGMVFSLPMVFPSGVELEDLDAFEQFHVDYDLAPSDDQVDASDDVTLEQP